MRLSSTIRCVFVDVQAEAVLNEILNERESERKSVLHADEKLTENDKKIQGKSLLISVVMNILEHLKLSNKCTIESRGVTIYIN